MDGSEMERCCVHEQRAAYRAIQAAISDYFSHDDNTSVEALEALGRQLDGLFRYARAIASVINLRSDVREALMEESLGDDNKNRVDKSWEEEYEALRAKDPKLAESVKEMRRILDSLQEKEIPLDRLHGELGEERKCVANRFGAVADVSMRRKPLKSLEKGMTINDRLYFRQELCGGDANRFKSLITKLDAAGSFEESMRLLEESCGAAYDSSLESIQRFVALLEQRYGSQGSN